MPVRGQGDAELVDAPLDAVRGRESVTGCDVAGVEAAGSAPSREEPLHATRAARAARSGVGRFLIESQR